ncbi:MAG: tetratricopeptide repeat protein [Gemmatimonadota bacterium]|nr:tetratricopeptide repeat protein [Gemmatimonadota bacterium]
MRHRVTSDMPKLPFRSALDALLGRSDSSASSPPAKTLSEGSEIGHYVIEQELGAGGMGVVYRARDTKLDREVALKFLPPHLEADAEAAQRLLVEARAAARLDHPNICTIHEIGTLDGRSYIAMAHYDGETLSGLIDRRGRLPAEEAATLACQIASGLARAHRSDIIHRDIKPANVLVTTDGQVKILDFGIAKVTGVDLTEAGAAIGTVAYMSPEQIRGGGLDARTDLWSWGVLLYEMCSAERPFIGADNVAMMHGILELDPAPLDVMIPGFPGRLWQIVERCLAKDPDDRFPDAESLIEALEICLDEGGATVGPADGRAPEPGLAAEGERRQATVLTARLAGRGALEESLSPDDADRLLEACQEVMRDAIAEFRGVVNRETGEGVEALFGIPSAHEDDAIRAVRAGRALCERVGALLADSVGDAAIGLRCGVDTGRVVARRDDTGAAAYRVAGEATELSARLAGQARVGEVVISDTCRRVVAPFFESASAGSLRRTGDQSTETFRVLGESGIKSRVEAAARDERLTTLAGRDAEIEALMQAHRTAAGGQGRFVSIVGDAGVGKSRLLHEFRRRLDGANAIIVRGRCRAAGSEVPYLPFTDALRDRLSLSSEAPLTPGAVAERVARLSPDLEPFTPFYLQLLSVVDPDIEEDARLAEQESLQGEQHRVGLVESLSAVFTLGSLDRPTVVLLEDWHWVDAASRDVLRQILEMLSAYPLLVVVTARPEGDLGFGAAGDHTPIVLGPLAPDDSGVIIRSVMRAQDVPTALTRFLHDRTGGNPFFLEEVCNALSEEGTLRVERDRVIVAGPLDNLELPDTVQGVLRTRLDRLDGVARRLIRYASVIGREFSRDILERALGDETDLSGDLDQLRELGLIQQIRVLPTPSYRFKHALTQDVAYDGLLERQRAEIHGAVGEALEALRPDRLEEHLDRLAHHFAEAGRWDRAVDYGVAAVDRLWAFSEFGEASELQGRVLDWVARLDDEGEASRKRVEMLFRQERLFEHLGQRDRQREIIDRLLETLDPEESPGRVGEAWIRKGDLATLVRDHAAAEKAFERAIELAERSGSDDLRAHAFRSLGLLRWHQRRHEEAIELVERALAHDRAIGNREAIVGNLGNLGALHRAIGDHERALEVLHEALDIERSIERRGAALVVKESYILHSIGVTHASLGEREKAFEYLERAHETVQVRSRVFNVVQAHFHLTAMARLRFEDGHIDDALALYGESVALCRRTRHLDGLSTSLRLRGTVLLGLERYEEAIPDLEEAAELYAHMQDLPSEAAMLRALGKAFEALGCRPDALEAWRAAVDRARGVDDPTLAREALEGVARLSRDEDPAASLKAYEAALGLVLETGDRAKIGSLRYMIGILRWEFGAYQDALGSFEKAYEDLLAAGDTRHAGLALNSVGRTLRDLGRFDEAIRRLEESARLNEANGERLLVAHAVSTLADTLLDAGDPGAAAERYRESLEIREAIGDAAGRGWTLLGLAKAHLARGKSDGATYFLDDALDVAGETGDMELRRQCETLRARLAQPRPED